LGKSENHPSTALHRDYAEAQRNFLEVLHLPRECQFVFFAGQGKSPHSIGKPQPGDRLPGSRTLATYLGFARPSEELAAQR